MRILWVATEYEYGNPDLGLSFEEMNFRRALDGMGHDVTAFDFLAREREVGRRAMNRELLEVSDDPGFDLVFFFLYEEQIALQTIEHITARGVPTLNWFADDHWRFEGFSKRYAKALAWSATTDHDAVAKYHSAGIQNVVLTQWACNRYAYDRTTTEPEYDVTFVGQPHGDRREVVGKIRAAGFDVHCWGDGWERGRAPHDEMVHIFGASRINLNLSNSSTPNPSLRMRLGALARGRRIDMSPRPSQIKGRTFEVPGSGGFLLTERVPFLEEYFQIGSEVAAFGDTDELIAQIGYWLDHDDERRAVADAGYRRTRAEHTYDQRFAAIFKEMGLA
jgi:spore maturation protein CgeB